MQAERSTAAASGQQVPAAGTGLRARMLAQMAEKGMAEATQAVYVRGVVEDTGTDKPLRSDRGGAGLTGAGQGSARSASAPYPGTASSGGGACAFTFTSSFTSALRLP